MGWLGRDLPETSSSEEGHHRKYCHNVNRPNLVLALSHELPPCSLVNPRAESNLGGKQDNRVFLSANCDGKMTPPFCLLGFPKARAQDFGQNLDIGFIEHPPVTSRDSMNLRFSRDEITPA